MYKLPFERETFTFSTLAVPVFLLVGIYGTADRYVRILAGTQQPHVDVRCCWRPLAEAVLAGQPIYVRPAVDNKPPLFELLNVAVAATGRYLLVFFLLVGLANALSAILLWRICARRGASHVGLVASLLFLVSVPAAGGIVVNVRSFAVAGILLSWYVRNPTGRGAAVAVAALFSQHAVFAIPALVYDRVRELDRRSGVRWTTAFALGGSSVVAATFAFVYVVWGSQSFYGAVYWTVGVAGKYATNPVVPSLVGDTDRWLSALYREGMKHLILLVPAAIAVQLALTDRGRERLIPSSNAPLVVTTTLLALSMTVPLFVRAYRAYWLYPLPFLALLASLGYQRLFTVGES
ncbi:hypothetical protein [Haladaptatus salinisoli]|uniref:hypothetical protein n=1 Tax=Haladaptatus salinisoli TaxID=2884876 RepID=UPI001D0A6123|nr:hypothetical protein [Haladaptatus salinisoli]